METKLKPMVDFILEIDWMTTPEFCKEYNIQEPYWNGNVESCANQFIKLDARKHKMFVEHAKLLNKDITKEILINCGFTPVDVRGGYPKYKNGKYEITNDQYGFWLEPYDAMDGCRVNKLNDLTSYGFTFNKK